MTEERQMVMTAVLEGKLSADHVSMDELSELEDLVWGLIADQQLQRTDVQYFEQERPTIQ